MRSTRHIEWKTILPYFLHGFIRFTAINFVLATSLTTQVSANSTSDVTPNEEEQLEKPLETITVNPRDAIAKPLDPSVQPHLVASDSIQFVNHEHINQILSFVPGTWISRGNGQEHLTALRSPVLTGSGSCGAFLMLEDGIPIRAPGFCNVNQLFEFNSAQARSIEVNLGPAYSQLGANILHGSINLLTQSAFALEVPELRVKMGDDDYQQALINYGQQSEFSAWRILANLVRDSGFQDDSGFGQQQLQWIHESDSKTWSRKSVVTYANLNQETAGFISGFEAYQDRALRQQNSVPEAYRDAEALRAYSEFSKASDNTVHSITPYLRKNAMEFKMHFLPWQPIERNGHSSLGVLLKRKSDLGPWTFAMNFNWEYTEGKLQEYQEVPFSPAIPEGLHYDFQVDSHHLSAAALAKRQLTPFWDITAAWRFSHTRYQYDTLVPEGSACESTVTNCRFFRPSDQARSFNDNAPRISVNYQPAENQRYFLSLARGINQPQANQLFRLQGQQVRADLDSERLDSFEVGSRGFYSEFAYSLSLYAMEKANFSFQDTQRFNVSEGKTSHYGVEFDVAYQWNSQFSTKFLGSYGLHRYQSDLSLSNENINGNIIDTAPRTIAKLHLEWLKPEFFEAKFGLSLSHMGEYYLDPENSAQYEGHELLDAFFSHRFTPKLSGQLKLLNMTNRQYAERADFAFGSYRYFVGEPRSLYYSLTVSI